MWNGSFKKLGSENCAAHLECDSLPGQLIKAGKKIVPDGEAVYYDNYMGCKYEDEIQTELEHAVRNVYPRSRVIFLTASSQFPDNMGPEMSVEDIIQDRDTLLAAVIVAEEKWDAGAQRDPAGESPAGAGRQKDPAGRESVCHTG